MLRVGIRQASVWAPSAVLGVTYTLDVLRLVPTFELGSTPFLFAIGVRASRIF